MQFLSSTWFRSVYGLQASTKLTQQTNYSRRQDNAGFARPKIDRLNETLSLLLLFLLFAVVVVRQSGKMRHSWCGTGRGTVAGAAIHGGGEKERESKGSPANCIKLHSKQFIASSRAFFLLLLAIMGPRRACSDLPQHLWPKLYLYLPLYL